MVNLTLAIAPRRGARQPRARAERSAAKSKREVEGAVRPSCLRPASPAEASLRQEPTREPGHAVPLLKAIRFLRRSLRDKRREIKFSV